MQLPKRSPRMEWNLNTVISLVTLASMIIGGVVIWVEKSRDIEDLQGWRSNHEQYHKDRLAEVRAIEAAYSERLRAGELKDNDFDRKLDNLTYRVTVTEQSAVTISSSIKELQTVVNKQNSDLQVVREILQRMEAAQQQAKGR